LASLRCVFLGGENISVRSVKPWLESKFCRAEIANTYGPTECADIAAFYRVDASTIARFSFVPIGKPVHNVALAVVNSHLKLCGIGMAGELCIGGAGVGIGYINDPELNRLKFIANPFAEIASPRLYRTGDFARYLPDGNIEFLGRKDHQVKIRGFRIELGEIENVLNGHPAVQQSVVVVREDERGDKCMAAYVVGKTERAASVEELRDYLKEKMPDYMVPSFFVMLEALPLTPNGKVDRKALPAPDSKQGSAASAVEMPRTPDEELMAGIWQEVLKVERVGVNENFFELGGHSLLAMQLVSKVRETFGVDLPLRSLFDTPTVAKLSAKMEQARGSLAQQTPRVTG
jgi:acyl-coenzyme A synthetase/AMP-(fatty) acid ligase/acyl carrier protein